MPPKALDSDGIPRIPLLGVLPSEESFDSPIDRRSDYYRQQAWQHKVQGKVQAAPKRQPLVTLPNVLTFLRLIMVPVLVTIWGNTAAHVPITCASLFVAASLTDWLDGYLARKVGTWPWQLNAEQGHTTSCGVLCCCLLLKVLACCFLPFLSKQATADNAASGCCHHLMLSSLLRSLRSQLRLAPSWTL